jgi:glycosyltransferase involved in cell wall biosynthesis
MDGMRLLVIQESDWLNVGTHDTHHLLERMSLENNKVRVIDFEVRWRNKPGNGLFSKRMVKNGVHRIFDDANITLIRPSIIRIPMFDYASIAFFHTLEIRRQIDEFKPDLIICLGIINATIARQMAHNYRIPYIYYLLDEVHLLIPQKGLQSLGKFLESRNIEKADLVITTNEAMREYAVDMGATPTKAFVIGHGVKLSDFQNANGKDIRTELGFKDEDVVLFFMGWLYPFSGIKEVAEDILKRKDSRIKLLVIGKGELLNDMKKISNESNGNVICLDWVDHSIIPDYLAASDICILPSEKVEIMRRIVPIKIVEYLASGKPVIATSLEGLIKEFGQNSGVVFIDSPHETLEKVEDILKSGKTSNLKIDAINYASKCDWKDILREFDLVLFDLATEHKMK